MSYPKKKVIRRTYLRVLPIVLVALTSVFLIRVGESVGEVSRRPFKSPKARRASLNEKRV